MATGRIIPISVMFESAVRDSDFECMKIWNSSRVGPESGGKKKK